MPNWTHARITAVDEEQTPPGAQQLMDFVERLRCTSKAPDGWHTHSDGQLSLASAFYPMPEELRHESSGIDPPWYRWANANWGVKWPDSDSKIDSISDDRIVISCRFPWTIANGLLQRIAEMFPALKLDVDWDDESDHSWHTSTYQAGQEPASVQRLDLELIDMVRRKAEYISEGWMAAHECRPFRCENEECPNGYGSGALKALGTHRIDALMIEVAA